MTKLLFLIHDLGHGGAEKVLVNLVNNMDPQQFDITVMALFGGGVNEQFLKPHIRYQTVFSKSFPGNSHVMKLFSPELLHKWFIREKYDVEISYLEGPSARIISGCPDPNTKLVSWIHCTMDTPEAASLGFRSVNEAQKCYNRMKTIIFVSRPVKDAFLNICPFKGQAEVLYNTNESNRILNMAAEEVQFAQQELHWCGMGKLVPIKGFDRMLRIHKRLRAEEYPVHFWALGEGPLLSELEAFVRANNLSDSVTFLGYQTNPYKYVAACDLFVCASHSEGFSTAATEALIVGTPVCTVEVSGMKEMLGENNEWGIVTENDEDALYQGIKRLLDDPSLLAHYREKAAQRGKTFSTENTVKAVEEMLLNLNQGEQACKSESQ